MESFDLEFVKTLQEENAKLRETVADLRDSPRRCEILQDAIHKIEGIMHENHGGRMPKSEIRIALAECRVKLQTLEETEK